MRTTLINNKIIERFKNDFFGLYLGRVIKIKDSPGVDTTKKMLFVDVEMDFGGTKSDVPFYGGGIDKLTKFPHGLFVPPRENQSVGVFFIQGDITCPVGCFPLPYPTWMVNEAEEIFFYELVDKDEIALYHYAGSRIALKKDGKIEIGKKIGVPPAAVDFKLVIEITATGIKIDTDGANPIILGNNIAAQLCNNLPNCIFSTAPHTLGNTKVKV